MGHNGGNASRQQSEGKKSLTSEIATTKTSNPLQCFKSESTL